MIVLDTNVLSEVLRPTPEPAVLNWMAAQPRSSLFTTTVTRGELLYGICLMLEGQRRNAQCERFCRLRKRGDQPLGFDLKSQELLRSPQG